MKRTLLASLLLAGACLLAKDAGNKKDANTMNPNQFSGSDTEKLTQAIAQATAKGECLVIPKRIPTPGEERTFWLIDEALLLPDGCNILLDDCLIKLSDKARDNFFRSANCGIGLREVKPMRGIRILGRGNAVLEGADHPRSTGDSGKQLGVRSYGTDAGKADQKQTGDWRNIGILLACVENFEIANLKLHNYHCWGISLEKCSHGLVHDIVFDTTETRMVDGVAYKMLNQDGLDLRKGCHHIEVSNISGRTGDDLVALTAIHLEFHEAGKLEYTEVSGSLSPLEKNDIHDILVRNVHGYSTGGHQIFRILNSCGIKIYDVLVEDVRDESLSDPNRIRDYVTIRIGDTNPAWGGISPLGDTRDITIRRVDSRSTNAILVAGSLTDSLIEDVINRNPACAPFVSKNGPDFVRNVTIRNAVTIPGE